MKIGRMVSVRFPPVEHRMLEELTTALNLDTSKLVRLIVREVHTSLFEGGSSSASADIPAKEKTKRSRS